MEGGYPSRPSHFLYHCWTETRHHLWGSAHQYFKTWSQRDHSLWLHYQLRLSWVSCVPVEHKIEYLHFFNLILFSPPAPYFHSGHIWRRHDSSTFSGGHLRVCDWDHFQQLCHLLGVCLWHSVWFQSGIWAHWGQRTARTTYGFGSVKCFYQWIYNIILALYFTIISLPSFHMNAMETSCCPIMV